MSVQAREEDVAERSEDVGEEKQVAASPGEEIGRRESAYVSCQGCARTPRRGDSTQDDNHGSGEPRHPARPRRRQPMAAQDGQTRRASLIPPQSLPAKREIRGLFAPWAPLSARPVRDALPSVFPGRLAGVRGRSSANCTSMLQICVHSKFPLVRAAPGRPPRALPPVSFGPRRPRHASGRCHPSPGPCRSSDCRSI